jgi:hypothetical protein
MLHQKIDEIDCGETTCASKPGEFCKYFRTKKFGQKPFCLRYDDMQKDEGGWVQRLPACIADYTLTTPDTPCAPTDDEIGCDYCREGDKQRSFWDAELFGWWHTDGSFEPRPMPKIWEGNFQSAQIVSSRISKGYDGEHPYTNNPNLPTDKEKNYGCNFKAVRSKYRRGE